MREFLRINKNWTHSARATFFICPHAHAGAAHKSSDNVVHGAYPHAVAPSNIIHWTSAYPCPHRLPLFVNNYGLSILKGKRVNFICLPVQHIIVLKAALGLTLFMLGFVVGDCRYFPRIPWQSEEKITHAHHVVYFFFFGDLRHQNNNKFHRKI